MLTRYFCAGLLIALVAALIFGATMGGVLVSLLFGFMAGNFACSLVHRLPRGKSLLEHAPYCGACAHPLSEMDLLPVFGVLLLKHKCRYCGVAIPKSHLWTELVIGALFALAYLQFGFSQDYLLVVGTGTFLVTLVCIEINESRIMLSIILVVAVISMVYRTLHDGEIYNFLQGALYGLMIGAVAWRKQIKRVNHNYSLPENARLTIMAGICTGAADVWPVLGIAAIIDVALRPLARALKWKRVPVSLPVSIAIILAMLFPQYSLSTLLQQALPVSVE